MLTVFMKCVRFFIVVVAAVSAAVSPTGYAKQEPIKDLAPDCKLSFAVISDTHLKDNFVRQGMLEFGFDDMSSAVNKLDLLVIDGDITDHGYIEMWDCFGRAISKYHVARDIMLVAGNHDTWGPERDNPAVTKETFAEYNKSISGRDISEMYYSDVVNGYYFIVLGSEDDGTNAWISQTQLDWFAAEMEKASQTNLPIFVFLHQPINGTHGLPYIWDMKETDDPELGGIGEQSDAVYDIIQKYKNVFYISGHLHNGITGKKSRADHLSVEEYDGYTLVNVPSYMYMDFIRGGHLANGTGFVIEAYSDRVVIRARNFAASTWLTQYDTSIGIE